MKRDSLIFLHSPIDNEAEDILGVSTYVKKLRAAIDAGAKMIAITSDFGSGKSSIIELFTAESKNQFANEKIVKIPMWSHVNIHGKPEKPIEGKKIEEGEVINLHRSFLYQLASQINLKKGTYINRRLSKNYGLLKLGLNRASSWVMFVLTLAFFACGWLIKEFPDVMNYMHFVKIRGSVVASVFFIVAMAFGLIVLSRADIIFSTNKSEGGREIDVDEIIDLYRSEILEAKRKYITGTHYIVVIEDLDRVENESAIRGFLTELRKYAVEKAESLYKNRVTFIVSIKLESQLSANYQQKVKPLYPKLFDYILYLRSINIDNYENVLIGLLNGKRSEIINSGFEVPSDGDWLKIEGIQWLIRGKTLGIREIKERLNIAFSLYQSLRLNFPSVDVAFKKCAALAYLATAFEDDFHKTDDKAFQEIINQSIKKSDVGDDELKTLFVGRNEDYVKAVKELIKSKLIDETYLAYFYNYPKDSYLFSSDELAVINAILYGEKSGDVEDTAQLVRNKGSIAFKYAFDKVDNLGISINDLIFETETLYVEALHLYFDGIAHELDSRDYSDEKPEKLATFFEKILAFDKNRKVFSKEHAKEFCTIWVNELTPPQLLCIRQTICDNYGKKEEILWYEPLFATEQPLMTVREVEQLTLGNALELFNAESPEMTIEHLKSIQKKFADEDKPYDTLAPVVEGIYRAATLTKIDRTILAPALITFMCSINQIIQDFESIVVRFIQSEHEKSTACFEEYQQLINQVAESGLDDNTLGHISELTCYKGYSAKVCEQLLEHKYFLSNILVGFHVQNYEIPFERAELCFALEEDATWLMATFPELFLGIRRRIATQKTFLLPQYEFIFGQDYPLISAEELNVIEDEQLAMRLLQASLVNVGDTGPIAAYFSRKKHSYNGDAFRVLKFISTFTNVEAKKVCFEALDFSNFTYSKLSKDNRAELRQAFGEAMMLTDAAGLLNYMKITKYLDENIMEEVRDTLKDDKTHRSAFIELVNDENVNKRVSQTLDTLFYIGHVPAMSPKWQGIFLEKGKYNWYVCSKIMYEKRFDIEGGAGGNDLWSTYVEIFCSYDDYYIGAKEYMSKNQEFLQRIMVEKLYVGMSSDTRKYMCGTKQDADCIIDAFEEYGEKFALEYYKQIAGFYDAAAANVFLSIVQKSALLLSSNELYDHTYGMLPKSSMKRKYTRMRKQR